MTVTTVWVSGEKDATAKVCAAYGNQPRALITLEIQTVVYYCAVAPGQ